MSWYFIKAWFQTAQSNFHIQSIASAFSICFSNENFNNLIDNANSIKMGSDLICFATTTRLGPIPMETMKHFENVRHLLCQMVECVRFMNFAFEFGWKCQIGYAWIGLTQVLHSTPIRYFSSSSLLRNHKNHMNFHDLSWWIHNYNRIDRVIKQKRIFFFKI